MTSRRRDLSGVEFPAEVVDDPPRSCPVCGYILKTAGGCPECGASPEKIASLHGRSRRRIGATVTAFWILVALYLPQCWIFLMPGSWSLYRWSWIEIWPVMPGFIPGLVGGVMLFGVGRSDPLAIASMAAATVGLALGAFFIARRGPRRRVIVCGGLFFTGVLHAFILHGLYAA